MRALFMAGLAGMLCFSHPAFANVKVVNKDLKSHEVVIKCSSSAQSHIGASSTRDVGKGPCTVTVKPSGSSATGAGNDTLTIKDGKISK